MNEDQSIDLLFGECPITEVVTGTIRPTDFEQGGFNVPPTTGQPTYILPNTVGGVSADKKCPDKNAVPGTNFTDTSFYKLSAGTPIPSHISIINDRGSHVLISLAYPTEGEQTQDSSFFERFGVRSFVTKETRRYYLPSVGLLPWIPYGEKRRKDPKDPNPNEVKPLSNPNGHPMSLPVSNQTRAPNPAAPLLSMSKTGYKVSSAIVKQSTKGGTKVGLKAIPAVGLGLGLLFGAWRICENPFSPKSYVLAGAEVASGALSCFPGPGTAAGLVIDSALVVHDIAVR